MGRPAGGRNAGYSARRRAIARRVLDRLACPQGAQASLRDLAQSAGVSVSTLRHYFGDRQGALHAAISEVQGIGEPWLRVAASHELDQPLRPSLVWFLGRFVEGWHRGVGPMVAESLAAATGDGALGPAAVSEVLEPTLQAVERRLAHHQGRGELADDVELRHAALTLFCPVLLALLHQDTWSGDQCRPLDLSAFVVDHVDRFARGWGTTLL